MAKIIPDGWRELEVTGGAQREIETLAMLAAGLPDSYRVYHAVHWTNVGSGKGFSIYGEIDFVVVNETGDLLLIEQKSGPLEETPGGLVKRYDDQPKSVNAQMARNVAEFQRKLYKRPGCNKVRVENLLYCPDYRVQRIETAGLSPERIIDSRRRDELATVIQQLLPDGPMSLQATRVDPFLRGLIQLEPDVSALVGRAEAMVTRVAGGLAHWARQIEIEPFRLRVVGTAGSGKTQLALKEYAATIETGGRPLYVCFNRPLADHFAQIAPRGGVAATLHMLCDQFLRDHGVTPDFHQPGAFERLVEDAAARPVGPDWRFDTVIVDEGQDFHVEWRDLVFRHAREDARILWLEDPMQNLYGRPEVPLPGWVRLRANSNYRSPRGVVQLLASLLPEGESIEPAGPFLEADVEVLTYADGAGLAAQVKEGLRRCQAAGYRPEDMAIVTFRGREQSGLFAYTQLGRHTLCTFTGAYDLLGHPQYSDGKVLLETVYRFKGQAAPAIIFAELDFEALDDRTLRKLFVGMTRARLKLILVVSERAERVLREALGGN
jgi:hypothetical protein